jgi:drug/metabolite transporter (DMT)-like permease
MHLFLRNTIAFAAVASVILFVLVDFFSVKWVETGKAIYIPVLIFLGLAAYRTFGWVGAQTSLSITSGLINTGIVIGSILVGILIRHDSLDLQQRIGLILAVVAIGILTVRPN